MWAADKVIPTATITPFRSNVIDFDSEPSCWAGKAFDYVHYTVPRVELDDIAADLGFGHVRSYRLSVVEDDLVLAQTCMAFNSGLLFDGDAIGSETLPDGRKLGSHVANLRFVGCEEPKVHVAVYLVGAIVEMLVHRHSVCGRPSVGRY